MTIRPAARGARFRRALVAVLVAAVAAPGTAAAAARSASGEGDGSLQAAVGHLTVERGIVQYVASDSLTIRTLDGAALTLRVADGARIVVDGRRARLRDVLPGSVVAIAFGGNGSAVRLEALSAARPPKAGAKGKGDDAQAGGGPARRSSTR